MKNEDLWRRLDAARGQHEVAWHWVKGHATDALNNRVDGMARAAIEAMRAGKRALEGSALKATSGR